jgi:hypothetical protein
MRAMAALEPCAPRVSAGEGSFVLGLAICILSGLLSPGINFVVAFGGPIKDAVGNPFPSHALPCHWEGERNDRFHIH